MNIRTFVSLTLRGVRVGMISLAALQLSVGPGLVAAANANALANSDGHTATPIKHVIVIIGENRSFDHVFATYVPQKGQTVWNLLSEGIVNADGTTGPNFPLAEQKAATDAPADGFLLSPTTTSTFPGSVPPAPLNGGPTDSYIKDD